MGLITKMSKSGNDNTTSKHSGVCMTAHHTAVSARVSQRQSELSGPARVHAELEAQSLAARSGEAQGPDPGVAHRHPD